MINLLAFDNYLLSIGVTSQQRAKIIKFLTTMLKDTVEIDPENKTQRDNYFAQILQMLEYPDLDRDTKLKYLDFVYTQLKV